MKVRAVPLHAKVRLTSVFAIFAVSAVGLSTAQELECSFQLSAVSRQQGE